MKNAFVFIILFACLSCVQDSPDPKTNYAARVSGTPGMSFLGSTTAFRKSENTTIFQDFIGNIPLEGSFTITFEEQIKGIDVFIQKEGITGKLKLELFINDIKVDSATTSKPYGSIRLKAGQTIP